MLRVLLDTLTTGLPLVPLVLGIYLVFRLRNDFDLTIDASFAFGAALFALCVTDKLNPVLALLVAFLGSAGLGLLTAALTLLLRVPVILAGLIMSIGFFSVTLRALGLPTVSLAGTPSLLTWAERATNQNTADLRTVAVFGGIVALILGLVGIGLRTQLGLALRATGVNARMARSCGVNDNAMLALSLALANGLAGASGALTAQGQSFADVNMGAGVLISGIGAVLLGDLLLRPAGSKVLRVLCAVAVGALLYRFVLVYALRLGVPATDLKGVTALILVAALAGERYLRPLLTAVIALLPSRAGPNSGSAGEASAPEVADARS